MGLQVFQDARSRFFRQVTGFFNSLDISLHSKVPNKPSANLFFHFSGLNPPCRNTFRSQHTRLITLASTVNMFINSVHICLCQEEKNHLQINKKKKKHVCRDGYYLSDCSLKKIVQNYVATALIKSCSSINIL